MIILHIEKNNNQKTSYLQNECENCEMMQQFFNNYINENSPFFHNGLEINLNDSIHIFCLI